MVERTERKGSALKKKKYSGRTFNVTTVVTTYRALKVSLVCRKSRRAEEAKEIWILEKVNEGRGRELILMKFERQEKGES